MNVGSICYACCSGLGILAKSFFDAGIVTDMFVVEHSRHPTQWDWYPDAPHCPIREMPRRERDLRSFVDAMDVLLCFETPFYWPIVDYAKSRGVKTVLQPMYECSLTNPPAHFDEYWCPSLLDLRYFSEMHMPEGERVPPFEMCHGVHESISRFTPVPVEVEWKQRHTAKIFVHNAGHGGLKGRNGTKELLQAMQFVKSPINLIVRSQGPIDDTDVAFSLLDQRVTTRIGTVRQEDLYSEGDVFIFPEKFNGLSLPLQEARAAGMLVVASKRFPITTWLPQDSLIPVSGTTKDRIGPPYMEYENAVINPRDIAETIDRMYDTDITEYSLSGRAWAEENSWNLLGPKYIKILNELTCSR